MADKLSASKLLGPLDRDSETRSYRSTALSHEGVELTFSNPENVSDQSAPFRIGEAIVQRFRELHDEARLRATEDLFLLKNENWLDDEESPVSIKEFMDSLKLSSIDVACDCLTRWYFEDGDLFAGHFVVVTMEADLSFSQANLAG